jgi:flagellin
MGLRINTNVTALFAHKNLVNTDQNLARSIERLSSGYRINHAKDDVAGLAIANSFKAQVRALRVAEQNTSQAQSLLQVAEGGAMQIQGILERLSELAASAASANTDAAGKTRLDAEATELINELDRIVNDTKYGDAALIDGTATSMTFQVGSSNTADDQIAVNLSTVNLTSTTLGVADGDIDLSTAGGAQAAIDSVENAISAAGASMGTIGAAMSRLQFAAANLSTSVQNLAASESTIRDADMAFEMIDFTKNQILLQAGTAMLAQANMAPQVVLQLLG